MKESIWCFSFNSDRPMGSWDGFDRPMGSWDDVDGQVYVIGSSEVEALAVAKKEYPALHFSKGHDCGFTVKITHNTN